MRRSFIGVAVTATLLLGFAASAWAASPPIGIYQGIVNGTSHSPPVCGTVHNEGEGYFRVKRNQNGVKRIYPVGNSNYCGGLSVAKIQVPSDPLNNCNSANATLSPNSLSLSQGAFSYSGSERIGGQGWLPRSRQVQVKGHWDSSLNRFVGFTRIKRDGSAGDPCDSGKEYWRMKKVG